MNDEVTRLPDEEQFGGELPVFSDSTAVENDIPEMQPSSPLGSEQIPTPDKTTRPIVWFVGFLAVLAIASLVLVGPGIEWIRSLLAAGTKLSRTAPPELLLHRTMETMTFLWFFMLGGSFGSFLHCVEYRLPRGISIAASGSACPHCGTKIKLWHNVPVFGWLGLGGRCANCAWPIPARYAVTELIFAMVFVLLAAVEIAGAGLNFPLLPLQRIAGVSWTLWTPRWDLIGIYLYHVSLVTFLMTFALFALDRVRVSKSLVVISLVGAIVAPLVWPELQLLSWDGLPRGAVTVDRLQVAIGLLTGCLEGLFLAFVIVRTQPANVRHGDRFAAILGSALIGICLGWQAMLSVALLASVLRVIACTVPGNIALSRTPLVAFLACGTFIHLLLWRQLAAVSFWPGGRDQLLATGIAVAIIAVLSRLADLAESELSSHESEAELDLTSFNESKFS